jgi:hypothetical protein
MLLTDPPKQLRPRAHGVHPHRDPEERLPRDRRAAPQTARRHHRATHSLPPVLVTVVAPPRLPGVDKPATLSLRIRDQGGGVTPANMARIFSYAFTTAGRRAHEDGSDNGENGGGPYAAQQHVGGAAAVGSDAAGGGAVRALRRDDGKGCRGGPGHDRWARVRAAHESVVCSVSNYLCACLLWHH